MIYIRENSPLHSVYYYRAFENNIGDV